MQKLIHEMLNPTEKENKCIKIVFQTLQILYATFQHYKVHNNHQSIDKENDLFRFIFFLCFFYKSMNKTQ